jgi:hypothetical protein
MEISNQNKSVILDEIDFVLEKMKTAKDPLRKLYFFSGIYAVIQRVFNIEYDEDLVFAHLILNETYKAFMARLKPGEPQIGLREEQLDRLQALAEQLAENFSSNRDLYSTLREFSILAYSTTGNGNYLLEKGMLHLGGKKTKSHQKSHHPKGN